MQNNVKEDINFSKEKLYRKTDYYNKKIEELKMELTRAEALKSIAKNRYEKNMKLLGRENELKTDQDSVKESNQEQVGTYK